MGTLVRGSNFALVIFASPFSVGQLLNERICSFRSKFFPLKVDPFWKGFYTEGSKQEVTKVVSLCKYDRKKHERIPIHLNASEK